MHFSPGKLTAAVVFTAETPCNAARAAPRDRMVGSFFAMSHLPEVRYNQNYSRKIQLND
jgi:hypothetical protein